MDYRSRYFVDYNIMGVVTVVLFHLFRNVKCGKLWKFIGMFLLNIVWHKGLVIPVTLGALQFEFSTQYFGYVFYPLHMLVLYVIWLLL